MSKKIQFQIEGQFQLNERLYASSRVVIPWLFIVTLVTLFYGLKPFNFNSENHVYWLQGNSGIQLHKEGTSLKLSSPGIIQSPSPLNIRSATKKYHPATIELYVEPHHEAYNYVAHILAFGDGIRIEPFIIGQWRRDLEIICQGRDGHAGKQYKHVTLEGAFRKNVKLLITVASGQDQTRVYLDGQLAKTIGTKALIGPEQLKGHLMLGNASDCGNQWSGKLFGLALYSGVLSPEQVHGNYDAWISGDAVRPLLTGKPIILYTFDEQQGTQVLNQVEDKNHLIIPEAYSPLKRNMLMFCGDDLRMDRALLKDVIINVLGFMPIAFFMMMYFNGTGQKTTLSLTLGIVLIGALMSLGIEISQAYLPTRSSSLLDVICNAFGSYLGVLSYKLFGLKVFMLRRMS